MSLVTELNADIVDAKSLSTQAPGIRTFETSTQYSFAVAGGAIGVVYLALDDIIPQGALVTGVTVNTGTALASGGAATIALSVGTAANSVIVAAGVLGASPWNGAVTPNQTQNIQVNLANPIRVLAPQSTLAWTVAVAALTAGVITLTVQYKV